MGGQTGNKKRKGGNPGVGVDFKKVKHKVGKKLPKAQNDTDTSFKARNINLPSQGVKDDKGGLATNFHNLTLKELLAQTSHYSEKTRKAALSGLGDLFSRHPHELTNHVGLVYSRLVERIADSDEGVRSGLQSLLRDHVCRKVTPGQLRPFMPMIMAHVSGATTHLSLDIRNDALVFLDIMMDHCPQLVAGGFLLPCLSHFCDLLSSGHRSRSIKGQSLKALLTVLNSLTDFLRRAFPSTPSTTSQPSQQQQQQQEAHGLPLYRHRCAWPASRLGPTTQQPSVATGSSQGLLSSASGKLGTSLSAASGSSSDAGPPRTPSQAGHTVVEAAMKLLGLLMECWPECSPATLSVSPSLDQATALVLILTSCRILMGSVLGQGEAAGEGAAGVARAGGWQVPAGTCQLLLRCIAPHFPVSMPAVRPSAPVLDHMVQYNLGCAQVLVRLLPATLRQAAPPSNHPYPTPQPLPGWSLSLVDFYERVLRTGQVVASGGLMSGSQSLEHYTAPGSGAPTGRDGNRQQDQDKAGGGGGGGTDRRATSAAYTSVLAGVEEMVGVVPLEVAGRLVTSVESVASTSASRSGVRAACLQLQHRLMKRWQDGELQLDPAWVASWLGSLPRLLWDLAATAPATSALALSMLHDAARFCPPPQPAQPDAEAAAETPLQAALQQLQPQLAPLWAVQLPARPAHKVKGGREQGGDGGGGVVAGPITQLPEHLQLLAIDTLYHLGPLHSSFLSAALRVIHHQLLPTHTCIRLVETCMRLAAASAPDTAASLILTLLFAAPAVPSGQAATQQQQQSAAGSQAGAGAPATQQQQQQPGGGSGSAVAADPVRAAAAQRWQVSSCVLQMAQAVAPASVLLQLLSGQLQRLLQPVLLDGSSQPSQGSHTVLHAHCVLRLSVLALEEKAAGQRDAVPVPEWLDQALPSLAIWYCMHEAAGEHGISVAVGWQGGNQLPVKDHAGSRLAVQLCAAQPQLAMQLLEAAAAAANTFRGAGPQGKAGGSVHTSAAAQYAGLLALARGLVCDGVVRRQLLVHAAGVKGAAQRLVAQDGLPSHVTADLVCMAAVQQFRHAVNDLLGTGGVA